MKIIRSIMLLLFFCATLVWSQGKPYEGPDDEAGDPKANRAGWMNGNQILLYFQNSTELAWWFGGIGGNSSWSRWPDTYEGLRMLDGIGLLIGAKVYLENSVNPVENADQLADLSVYDSLFYLQTSYREEMDWDPTKKIQWGLYPVFGYFNEKNDYPATSNRPSSWPTAGWPVTNGDILYRGEWLGRFGRGIIYADLESFFVANDGQDLEYLGPEDRIKYAPRGDIKIGDKNPAYITTSQLGKPWGGLGVRVEQRGFQWNNQQARNAIFWEYNIANISNYRLPFVAFGYWVDNAIGGESDDELGYFNTNLDMAYSWDKDGVGYGGIKTGTMGFAYLESPGKPDNDKDDDNDGLEDENRNDPAGSIVGPEYHFHSLDSKSKFLDFYHLKESDLRDHYEGDEDQDWQDGIDANNSGYYEVNEYAGDDVGLDGVGPLELNYTGPDEGECNHKPDGIRSGRCEPNFNATDVSESDMVGLTSFNLFPIPSHSKPNVEWFKYDQTMWNMIGGTTLLEEYLGTISNLVETFASGPFPLERGSEEHISMAELHSYDAIEGLQSDEHTAPALYEQKKIVQVIYEKDYRFAGPPKMPTLKATAGDGKVILTWDDIADTKTLDPFMGNVNDFEGYKLFRATDKKMSDAKVITDGFGSPDILKPIFQCDKKDSLGGFATWGALNGAEYYLGDETGIIHHFPDHNVQNGRTYYYAIVAYDYGAPDIGPGIAPSENNITIELDNETEEIRVLEDGTLAIGTNVAIVTPHPVAAGYTPPAVEQSNDDGVLGSGRITPQIIAESSLKTGHTYHVVFNVDTLRQYVGHGLYYRNDGMRVFDATVGNKLVYEDMPNHFAFNNLVYIDTTSDTYWMIPVNKEISTDVFDGMVLKYFLPVETAEYDYSKSGWLKGEAEITIGAPSGENVGLPWDYEIIFTNDDSAYVGKSNPRRLYDENNIKIDKERLITRHAFNFYVLNKSFSDTMDLIIHDAQPDLQFDLKDRVLVGSLDNSGNWAATAFAIEFSRIADSTGLPKPDDVYRIYYKRPFVQSDTLKFTINEAADLNIQALKTTMDDIKVVPNPYVATNAMEPAVANTNLNQRRKIMFTHIPAECTIKIFTVSGLLVDQIDVDNDPEKGIIHWDLTSKEGLEIAAGIYIYHIKAHRTGDEKIGKFAVIK